MALGYKQLLQVEAAWRTLKQELAIRPVYHRLSRRIRIHVLLSWLALLLVRVAEVRLERKGRPMTWRRLRAELDRIHAVLLEGPSGRVRKTTQLGPERAALFEALGVQRPPLLLSAEPVTARKPA